MTGLIYFPILGRQGTRSEPWHNAQLVYRGLDLLGIVQREGWHWLAFEKYGHRTLLDDAGLPRHFRTRKAAVAALVS